MSFHLGVWNSPTAISDDEAAARYRALSDEKSVEPQAGKVYLPPRLEKKPAASATSSACASEPQPAAMQANDGPKAGGGDDAACLRAEK